MKQPNRIYTDRRRKKLHKTPMSVGSLKYKGVQPPREGIPPMTPRDRVAVAEKREERLATITAQAILTSLARKHGGAVAPVKKLTAHIWPSWGTVRIKVEVTTLLGETRTYEDASICSSFDQFSIERGATLAASRVATLIASDLNYTVLPTMGGTIDFGKPPKNDEEELTARLRRVLLDLQDSVSMREDYAELRTLTQRALELLQ